MTRLRQPDSRSCGAAVLVRARMWQDPAYDARVRQSDGFAEETLAMHRRVTSSVDARGRLQLPWPRALGTPPWAVAHQLEALTGRRYGIQLARWSRARLAETVLAGASERTPVALYVGSRWLPRHVVLALDTRDRTTAFYDPSRGETVRRTADDLASAQLRLAGWDVPWFVVTPGRRTPA